MKDAVAADRPLADVGGLWVVGLSVLGRCLFRSWAPAGFGFPECFRSPALCIGSSAWRSSQKVGWFAFCCLLCREPWKSQHSTPGQSLSTSSALVASELLLLHISQCLFLADSFTVLELSLQLSVARHWPFLEESHWVSHTDEPKCHLPRLDYDLLNQSVSSSCTLFS